MKNKVFRLNNFFTHLSLLLMLAVLTACGGGGGGGDDTDENIPPIGNMSGDWQVTSTDSSSTPACDGASVVLTATIIQPGNDLTVTGLGSNSLAGNISGDQMTWAGSYPEDGGTTTISASTSTITSDCNQFTGNDSWSWSDGTFSCSGTSQFTATRLTGSGCGAVDINQIGVWEDIPGTERSIGSYHTSVWAQSDSNVMVAGANGGVVQISNGELQQTKNVGTGSKLEAIWGTGNTNVYVGAELSRIFNYDGTTWRSAAKASGLTLGYVRGIWGSSETDIYFVGANGFIVHSDGTLISSRNSNTFYDLNEIWGSSADDIYAVGGDAGRSLIQHYDGTSWSNTYTDVSGGPFFDVWGSSANNIYAVGYGRIAHFDGVSWNAVDTGFDLSRTYIYGVWGSSANNVYVVAANNIYHFDGTIWSIDYSDDNAYFTAVHGTAEGEVYVVGSKVVRHSFQ